MTPAMPTIRRATSADVQRTADLIAEAMASLPTATWLVPDPTHRIEVLAAGLRQLVEHAVTWGHVDLLTDGTGAAVWLHRDQPVPPVAPDPRLVRPGGMCPNRLAALRWLRRVHQPTHRHHHLAALAVRPGAQRTGRGAALLDHHHARLDRAGMPAGLQALTLELRSTFAGRGYAVLRRAGLPDGPAFWPMWRPPRPYPSDGHRRDRSGRVPVGSR